MAGRSIGLARLRLGIDALDDALLVCLAARRRLVAAVARVKQREGLPVRDAARERRIDERGQSLARRLGLPPSLARAQLALAVADGRCLQGLSPDPGQGAAPPDDAKLAPAMTLANDPSLPRALLRAIPPPARWAPLLRRLPSSWPGRALEPAVQQLLAAPLRDGQLDFLVGRRLGIAVSDLGIGWVFALRGGRLHATPEPAEATVRGTATDLMLLASRLEDADTLFFQRRLELTGDTELGLTARNLLDRLPWESVPLGVRILLHRGARLAREARDARRGEA
ncbi:ubiquinone anaerobic biosynthesis accessory factor UbiT [Arenimonas metalli]|uniref:ubiquinone anaerobic biosynthesis accessory factor UbiT n=1 Tax=Arenimonas metalli TaxID=948077 RepID=UPI001FE1615C|nr:SCP2 sterol-binding domain-containing protein [Arenimonas metalli]